MSRNNAGGDAQRTPIKANERPKHGPRTIGHGPMAGHGVAEKAVAFGPSLRRLLGQMRPERLLFIVVVLMGIGSVVAAVIGPRILGWATDAIFAGIIGKNLPAGMTQAQVIEMLRAASRTNSR